MIRRNKLFENDTLTPLDNSDAYNNQEVTVTGGGRQPNYPISNSSYRYVLSNFSGVGYGPAFTSGYFESSTVEELQRLFLGTDRSAQTAYQLNTAKIEADQAWDLAQQNENDYFNNVWSPAYDTQIALAIQYNNAGNYAAAIAALAVLNEYDAVLENYQNIRAAAGDRYFRALDAHGTYILTGKINNPDPFQLDYPYAAAERERKKRDQVIDNELKKLALDNERIKTSQGLRAAQTIIGIGFDIATAIAILNIFSGPADEAAIIAGKIGAQEMLEKLGQKGGKEAVEKVIEKAAQKIPSHMDDAATATIEKLLRSKGSLGDDAAKLASKIDDALASGDKTALQKAIKQGDDLLYGKVTPRPTKPAASKPHPGTTGPVYQGAHRASPGPYPYRVENNETKGKFITEDRKIQILKEIKKPIVIPELPKKYKMNFSGKYSPQNTPDKTASQVTDALVASGNARGQKWRIKDKAWQGYETTERMNIVYDRVGHGEKYWDMIVNENKNKKTWRDRRIQEHLNIIAHEKAMIKENPSYKSPFNKKIEEQETLSAPKDPLIKRITKKLASEIDYPEKPSRFGYPTSPPPETINGYHPDLVDGKNVSNRFNRLDPESAKAMPLTGNLHVDKKVKAARKKPK